jgi:hypothetical protein
MMRELAGRLAAGVESAVGQQLASFAEHMQVGFELAFSVNEAGDLPAAELDVHRFARTVGIGALRQSPVRASCGQNDGASESQTKDEKPMEHRFDS